MPTPLTKGSNLRPPIYGENSEELEWEAVLGEAAKGYIEPKNEGRHYMLLLYKQVHDMVYNFIPVHLNICM